MVYMSLETLVKAIVSVFDELLDMS